MRWRGRKWNVSSNDRYLVHDLNEEEDGGALLFDVKETISSLLIDCTYTFSVSEHDNYAEIYVGHSGITLALFELSTQWCLTTTTGDGQESKQGHPIVLPDWKRHFDDHLTLKHFSKRRFTFLEGIDNPCSPFFLSRLMYLLLLLFLPMFCHCGRICGFLCISGIDFWRQRR